MGPSRYTLSFVPDYLDIDYSYRVKPSFLLNSFQLLSGVHADMIGVGYGRMAAECNAFWVLSRIHVKLERVPMFAEKLNITTWPLPAEGASCMRCYKVEDEKGNVICRAKAMYLILDLTKHTLRTPKSLGDFGPDKYETETYADIALDKILPEPDMSELFSRPVRLSDLDMNMHMNNAKYADLLFDAFSADEVKDKYIGDFQINFVSQLREGDNVTVCRNTGGSLVFGADDDKKQVFISAVSLK